MPILKYTFFVGCSLLALLFVAERTLQPASPLATNSSTSLEVLRKMANHGETRGFAPLADAGAFTPMPMVAAPAALVAASELTSDVKNAAVTPPQRSEAPAVLNAQARISETDVVQKPSRPMRKMANKRPKQSHSQYVENIARGQIGFFGALQSW